MAETIARFKVESCRYLDPQGEPLGSLPDFAADAAFLIRLYRAMVLTRIFDEKAVALQRTGRLGTYASALGEEAVGVGVASAMTGEDVLIPSFREQGAQIWRGVTPLESLCYWGGSERGSAFSGPLEDFPICVPVGTQFPHAAGVALAFRLRKQPRVAVSIGGDGSTSTGDFAEALNIAGVWNLPAVFVIANNQWAISVPRARQTAAQTLAQKAIAAGMSCAQVDGNDVIAVHDVARTAIERARAGEGPMLIEAVTYRITDHTTADDARRYREDSDVSAQWKNEPVARLRNFLVARYGWDKGKETALRDELVHLVNDAVEDYLQTPDEPLENLFDFLFAELPDDLKAQRASFMARNADEGGASHG